MNKRLTSLAAAILTAGMIASAPARAALTAGDIAIIGWIDNGSPDSFSFVTLANVAAGEVVYFTDNGWTGLAYRSGSPTDGDGNENLIKWTANNAIAAGTIINSNATGADYTWTASGSVPGGTSGSFANLSLNQTGEQIYAFQGTNSLPLQHPSQHLFMLDDTNVFENAATSSEGNVAPGLTAGQTALTFNFTSANYLAVSGSVLGGAAKTKDQWLAAFADSANWTTGASGALPTGTIAMAAPVPEADTYAFMALGMGLVGLLARRRRA